jgi:hypothetical protein
VILTVVLPRFGPQILIAGKVNCRGLRAPDLNLFAIKTIGQKSLLLARSGHRDE